MLGAAARSGLAVFRFVWSPKTIHEKASGAVGRRGKALARSMMDASKQRRPGWQNATARPTSSSMSALRASASIEKEDLDAFGGAQSCAPSSSSKIQWVAHSSPDSIEMSGAVHSEQERAEGAQSGPSGDPPRLLTDSRSKSLQRYLSAQTDVDDEVLALYKMVCRV